ncbi:hypothetical protein QFC20_000867 [Naganishia adeliensis]|uniref:Uncharacterized protein n=1 Tax=Naganishia adeliensis TaxID=92952 RepID=A0ACC2WYR5_9TREE|nr:hypothetical protein QFC20_000867 [Naganishia adeliensis]
MKASVYDLASTGLTLALALLPTCAQAYREFEPGVVFAAAEPGDKEFGLDGFHLDYLYPLVREQLDPIVSPNKQSMHMHRVFGGSKFGAGYNHDELASSNCTTAGISVDKSNYWEPQLYWLEANGSFTAVPSVDRFYYFLGRVDASIPVKAFPKGLRIFAGDPFNKAPIEHNAAEFICQVRADFSRSLGLDSFNFPRDCPWGLKTAMHFPSCWDGVHLYKTGNSHMAYPVVNPPRDGGCPYTHPHKLPTIFFESTWHMSKLPTAKGKPLKGRLAWANGDTTGYGYHADFTNGWDLDVLNQVLTASDDCVDLNKSIPAQDCSVLAKYMTPLDLEKAQSCPPERGVLAEPYGNFDSVPIPVLPGGAKGDKPTCDPPVPGLDVSSFIVEDGDYTAPEKDQAPFKLDNSSGWHDIGCYGTSSRVAVFNGNVSYVDTGLNPGRCQDTCSKNGMPFAGLQVVGTDYMCLCGKEMWPVAFNVYSACDRKCPGDSSQTCGGLSRVQAFYQNPKSIGVDQSAIYLGCLGHTSLAIPPTIIKQSTFNISRSDMTRETCLSSCREKGKTGWAAVQGNQCFCGNQFNLGDNTFLPESYCTTSCPGSSKELCGSNAAVSIFNLTNYAAQGSGGLVSASLSAVVLPDRIIATSLLTLAVVIIAA